MYKISQDYFHSCFHTQNFYLLYIYTKLEIMYKTFKNCIINFYINVIGSIHFRSLGLLGS